MSLNLIKSNPLISAEYLAWIRDKRGRLIPFMPNKVQKRYYTVKKHNIDNGRRNFLILKARRMGMTTYEQWENFHIAKFQDNQSVITVAHEKESTQIIFNIAKLFYDKLHPAFQEGLAKSNKREIVFPLRNSSFYIGTAGSKGFGRGQTLQKAHCSEVAFWPGKIDEVDNLMLGISEATSEGSVVAETTANGRDNWFFHAWEGAKKGTNNWVPIFFPWYEDEEYQIIKNDYSEITDSLDDEEKELMEKYSLSFSQLLWRREKIKSLRSLRKFNQEYPKDDMTAFLVSGHTFFDISILEKLITLAKPAIPKTKELIYHNDDIEYYYPINKNQRYYAFSDTAGGSITEESDFGTTTILDYQGRQAARLRTRMDPVTFARFNCNYFLPQFGNPQWAIEINNHGHSVLNTAANECNYPSLFRSWDNITGKVGKFGFSTDRRTRPMILDSLKDYLHDVAWNKHYGVINDLIFIDECFNFVDDDGKYEAVEGKHDDTVLSWAGNVYIRQAPGPDIKFV